MLHNRLTNGFIAGIAGGIAMNAFNLLDYYVLHTTTFRVLDWASVFIYGQRTQSLWGNIFALIAQIMLTSFQGVIFAHLVVLYEDRSYVFKGWYFGTICWLGIYSVDFLFKLHDMSKIPVKTGISDFLASSVFGIVLGEVLWLLDTNSFGITNKLTNLMSPAQTKRLKRKN